MVRNRETVSNLDQLLSLRFVFLFVSLSVSVGIRPVVVLPEVTVQMLAEIVLSHQPQPHVCIDKLVGSFKKKAFLHVCRCVFVCVCVFVCFGMSPVSFVRQKSYMIVKYKQFRHFQCLLVWWCPSFSAKKYNHQSLYLFSSVEMLSSNVSFLFE